MKHLLLLLSFFCSCNAVFSESFKCPEPAYVWLDSLGEGRNVYAYFRNEFELSSVPKTASMKLYAKSRYNLFVNGQFVNFGPIRSYPKYPYFDSINIAPYLKTGKNLVTVKVVSYGMHTYQVPDGTAGFIAWGEILSDIKSVSLHTPGNWLCRKAQGYSQLAPQFSFAQGPVEIYNPLLEIDDWQSDNIRKKAWTKPVLLNNQTYFGKLTPRTIPLLTNIEITAVSTVSRLKLTSNEIFYNWNAQNHNFANNNRLGILVYTYLYSPTDKDVVLGFSWGKFWLNGKLIQSEKIPGKPFRSDAKVHLKQGWNSLFSHQEIIWNNLDGMLTIPKNENIQLSVNKKFNDKAKIALTESLTLTEIAETGISTNIPDKPELLQVAWKKVSGVEPYINPAKELAWLDVKRLKFNAQQTTQFIIPANENQAVIYDLGTVHLGRIFVDIDAPKGTTIDLTWSEDIKDSLITLYKRIEANTIARFTARSGRQHLETFRPFGLRYLQVTVRNHKKAVTLINAGVKRQVYPYAKKGSFSCSDTMLNKIWEMGWRTIQVCSEDSYTDTPFRERGHYAGDFFPEFATTLATSGDTRLAKQTVRLFNQQYEAVYTNSENAANAEFPLINILVASWYIRQFNDYEFAAEIYPIFANYIRKMHEDRKANKYYQQKKVFIEWVKIDKDADLTAYQAIVKATFDEMSNMAFILDKKTESVNFKKWSDEIKHFVQTNCWDDAAGNFIDGLKDGEILKTRFPVSSTFPSVWKISTPNQEKNIQNWLSESLINIGPPLNRMQLTTPYGGFYALASLYQQENAALAEQYMRKHWGKMVEIANDLTWEDFNQDNEATMSHAWASSPTYYMSSQILGVDLGFPGNLSPDTIYIRPQSETLSWARGTVPHPKGVVSVDWKVADNKLMINYSAPIGIPVIVKPRGHLAAFQLIINKNQINYSEK